MKVGVARERRRYEKRVAASPDTVKRLVAMGVDVLVERDAGHASSMLDMAYEAAGARICNDAVELYGQADVILKVQRPLSADEGLDEMCLLRSGHTLIGHLEAAYFPGQVQAYGEKGVTAFALERIPRITRAQNMDILSSQSNLAGYRLVLDAAYHFGRAFPMMMTAAGTIPPAKVLVLGAGVAGLQAIATAKRLGAMVFAFDVRRAVKEQVESLGAKFVEVPAEEAGEAVGGYAKEMSEAYRKRQAAVIHETVKKMDIVISTALIPGKRAPILVTEEMVNDMKPGSVIADLAASAGGNCPLCVMDEVVVIHDVTIISYENVVSRLAQDASALFAKNVLNFLTLMIDKKTQGLKIDLTDEIIRETLVAPRMDRPG